MLAPVIPTSHTRKLPASGAATFWHGYAARLGFGTTRIRNQISASKPTSGKSSHGNSSGLRRPTIRPVTGHSLNNSKRMVFMAAAPSFSLNVGRTLPKWPCPSITRPYFVTCDRESCSSVNPMLGLAS